ncbi:hypothetical protein FOL47_008165 [Perkinsus chesapeaki]|uniref:AMP-dependent synthetase/ligase domain-containing protein n=1 Tax=Perkinsus chesapeaki TaxID=330153 RepID=A0A7J6MU86_PERCH|nr:hypothetical protein FOL47_008165 [Perkinsus chesapeaki]
MSTRAPITTFNDWFRNAASDKSTVAAIEMGQEGDVLKQITYDELYRKAVKCGVDIHEYLRNNSLFHSEGGSSRRTVALSLTRGIDWYIVYLGCLLAGIPTVSLTSGGVEVPRDQEEARAVQVQQLLEPVLLIGADAGIDCHRVDVETILSSTGREECDDDFLIAHRFHDDETAAFHFTGGSTASSKCVRITLGMIMHELDNYGEVIPSTWKGVGRSAVINSSSVYWAASCYGQVDICLAFGGTLIIPSSSPTQTKLGSMGVTEGPYNMIKYSMMSGRYDTVIAGLVPTLMEAMPPPQEEWWSRGGTIREKKLLVFTWGEACPQTVVNKWASATIIELLVATEYWLSLYCLRTPTSPKGIAPPVRYRIVSGCEVSTKPLGSSTDTGTMVMSGRMVTPGYVSGPLPNTDSVTCDGVPSSHYETTVHTAMFETEDVVRLVASSGGCCRSLVECLGREGDLIKVGGAFAKISMLEDAMAQTLGGDSKVMLIVDHGVPGGEIHAVMRFGQTCRISVPRALAAIRSSLPGMSTQCMHFLVPSAWLPTHPVTGKVVKRELLSMVTARPPPLAQPADGLLPDDTSYRELYELGGGLMPKSVARSRAAVYLGVSIHLLLITVFSVLGHFICRGTFYSLFLSLMLVIFFYYPLLDYAAIAIQSDTSPACGASIETEDSLERFAKSCAQICTSFISWFEDAFPYGEYCLKASLAVTLAHTWWSIQMLILVFVCITFPLRQVLFWPTISSVEAGIYLSHQWRWNNWKPYLKNPLRLICWYLGGILTRVTRSMSVGAAVSKKASMISKLIGAITNYGNVPKPKARQPKKKRPIAKVNRDRWYHCDVRKNCRTKDNKDCWFRESHGKWRWRESEVNWKAQGRDGSCDSTTTSTSTQNSQKVKRHGKYEFVCESCLWDDIQLVDVKLNGTNTRPPLRRPPRKSAPNISPTDESDTVGIVGSLLQSLGWESGDRGGCSSTSSLAGISSLSTVLLCAKASHRWGINVRSLRLRLMVTASQLNPREVMACNTLGDLARKIEVKVDDGEDSKTVGKKDSERGVALASEYRINMFATHLWKRAPCDWLFEYTDRRHPPTVSSIREALKLLVSRHPVFRSYPLDPLELQECCREVLSLASATGLESTWVQQAVKSCWPRVGPRKEQSKSIVPIHEKYFTSSKSESRASKSLRDLVVRLKFTEAFTAPIEFHILLPRGVDTKTEAFRWFYIYVRFTHLFADGFCVAPMARELDLVLKQVATGEVPPPSVCCFPTLQHRLFDGIEGSEKYLRLRQAMEIRRPSADNRTRTLWLSRSTTRGLAIIAKELQVPTEIVVLAVVMISLGRALEWDSIPLMLMRTNRDDSVEQSRMFGFFAEYADLGFIPCDYNTSLFDVIAQLQGRIHENMNYTAGAQLYSTSLADRPWTRKCFPITVNLITSLPEMDDLCVRHVSSYDRIERNGEADGRGMRPIHLYIEESRYLSTSDTDWGIRMMLDWEWFPFSWLSKCIGIVPTAQAIRAPARVNSKLVSSPDKPSQLIGVTPIRDLQYHSRDEVQKAMGYGSIPGTNDPSVRIYHLLPVPFPASEPLWTAPDPLVTDVIKVSQSTEPHRLGTLIYNRCRDGEEDITVHARGDIALAMAVRGIAKAAAKLVSFDAKRLIAIPVSLEPKCFKELQLSIRYVSLPSTVGMVEGPEASETLHDSAGDNQHETTRNSSQA